jgi:hypothetical protein
MVNAAVTGVICSILVPLDTNAGATDYTIGINCAAVSVCRLSTVCATVTIGGVGGCIVTKAGRWKYV